MILQKVATHPTNPGNALQMTADLKICCDQNAAAPTCSYALTIDSPAELTTFITGIVLGGVTYMFPSPISPTNAEALEAAIKAAINTAGYTADDVSVVYNATVGELNIDTDLSNLSFDELLISDGTPLEFTPTCDPEPAVPFRVYKTTITYTGDSNATNDTLTSVNINGTVTADAGSSKLQLGGAMEAVVEAAIAAAGITGTVSVTRESSTGAANYALDSGTITVEVFIIGASEEITSGGIICKENGTTQAITSWVLVS